jgi:hypothetical protein
MTEHHRSGIDERLYVTCASVSPRRVFCIRALSNTFDHTKVPQCPRVSHQTHVVNAHVQSR